MNALTVISTRDVAPADRLALWGDVVWRHVGRLQSDAFGDARFDGQLEYGDMGDLKLCRIVATRHRVVRTASLIRQDSRGFLKIVAQLQGSACFEQGDRRVVLTPGEWSIYDTTQSYAVTNPESVKQLVMMLPRERLDNLGVGIGDLTVRRFSGSVGVGRLAFDLLTSAFEEMPDITAGRAGGVADTLTDLIRIALLERAGIATDASLCETARERVKAYIDAHLRDPLLSLDRVAAAMSCSKRYLHKLFRDEAETLGCYMWQARLGKVRNDLADPALRGRSITEIAFSWGFNSSAHFSRSFRERFGVAPRSYRAMVSGDGRYLWRMSLAPKNSLPAGAAAQRVTHAGNA